MTSVRIRHFLPKKVDIHHKPCYHNIPYEATGNNMRASELHSNSDSFSDFLIHKVRYTNHSGEVILISDGELIDLTAGRIIKCSPMLDNSKAVSAIGMSCKMIAVDMAVDDDGYVRINWSDKISKCNSPNVQRVDYSALTVDMDKRGIKVPWHL